MKKAWLGLVLVLVMGAGRAEALNFSFTGNLTQDDQVLLFPFVVTSSSSVTLRSYSYAGGTNAAGQIIARGGFDTILALFGPTGALVGQQDDAGCAVVPADALTGQCWDTSFTTTLAPGNYTASVQQFNNFALGPNLSNGFSRTGQGNFTGALSSCPGNAPFQDVTSGAGCQRDSHWAFDVLNVASATGPGPGVPEPMTISLLGLGGLALRRRFRR